MVEKLLGNSAILTSQEYQFRWQTGLANYGDTGNHRIEATVRVQVFNDQTLRIQIRPIEMLIDGIGIFRFNYDLKEQLIDSFLVRLKKGQMNSFFVGKDEIPEIVDIKKKLLSILGVGRQLEDNKGVKYQDSNYGECPITPFSDQLKTTQISELEDSWTIEAQNAGLTPSLEGRSVCSQMMYAEFNAQMNLTNCKKERNFQWDLETEGDDDWTGPTRVLYS